MSAGLWPSGTPRGRKRSNIQSLIESRVSYNQGATGTSTIGWEKTGWYHPYSVESRQKSCMGRHGDRHSRAVVPDSISRPVGSSGCNSLGQKNAEISRLSTRSRLHPSCPSNDGPHQYRGAQFLFGPRSSSNTCYWRTERDHLPVPEAINHYAALQRRGF